MNSLFGDPSGKSLADFQKEQKEAMEQLQKAGTQRNKERDEELEKRREKIRQKQEQKKEERDQRRRAKAQNERDKEQKRVKIFAEYERARESTRQLVEDIQSSILKGEDPIQLFSMAIEALSIAIDDPMLKKRINEDMLIVYGKGLGYEYPLEEEKKRIKKSIRKLKKALSKLENQADTIRLQNALEKHQELLSNLKEVDYGRD